MKVSYNTLVVKQAEEFSRMNGRGIIFIGNGSAVLVTPEMMKAAMERLTECSS